jgi:hypothetical protein
MGLTGAISPENDAGKLQEFHLSVCDGERRGFHAKNEQKAQAGRAVFLKPTKPRDLQFALPEMRPRL